MKLKNLRQRKIGIKAAEAETWKHRKNSKIRNKSRNSNLEKFKNREAGTCKFGQNQQSG